MDNDLNFGGANQQAAAAVVDAPTITCECGCKTFTKAVVMKNVPGIYFGSPEPVLYPIPVYVCTQCGHVMRELLQDKELAKALGEEPVEAPKTEKESTIIMPNDSESNKQNINFLKL